MMGVIMRVDKGVGRVSVEWVRSVGGEGVAGGVWV